MERNNFQTTQQQQQQKYREIERKKKCRHKKKKSQLYTNDFHCKKANKSLEFKA